MVIGWWVVGVWRHDEEKKTVGAEAVERYRVAVEKYRVAVEKYKVTAERATHRVA